MVQNYRIKRLTCGSPNRGRLAAVAALVPPGSRVADVGTGHGLLALRLRASGRAAHCVATERNTRLLTEARRRAVDRLPGVELRAGDGLAALDPADRIDVVVLAGMGSRKMIRILADERLLRLAIRRLVLQPQCEAQRLRRWLADQGFGIVAESRSLERGRSYLVIAAERL